MKVGVQPDVPTPGPWPELGEPHQNRRLRKSSPPGSLVRFFLDQPTLLQRLPEFKNRKYLLLHVTFV